ncbi:HAD family hydrolase [Candidatus Altiarchaeota archaeon]
MSQVIVFDYDGTLVDTVPGIWAEFKRVRNEMGLHEVSYHDFCMHVGKPWAKVLKGLWPDVDVSEFSAAYDKQAEGVKPVAGGPEALAALHERFMLCLLTSRGGGSLFSDLPGAGYDVGLFNMVFQRDNMDVHKPDPAVFAHAARMLSVNAGDLVYVGDAVVDARSAIDARLRFIGVLSGAATEDDFRSLGVKEIVDSVADLPDYL